MVFGSNFIFPSTFNFANPVNPGSADVYQSAARSCILVFKYASVSFSARSNQPSANLACSVPSLGGDNSDFASPLNVASLLSQQRHALFDIAQQQREFSGSEIGVRIVGFRGQRFLGGSAMRDAPGESACAIGERWPRGLRCGGALQFARGRSAAAQQRPRAESARLKTDSARQAIKKEASPRCRPKNAGHETRHPDANLTAGKFALLLGRCRKGHGAAGEEQGRYVERAGEIELSPPKEGTEQAKLADGWFDRAEKETLAYLKTRMQERARFGIRQRAGVDGLAK